MSAFGTKKRGADLAQQLTFPAVFSEAVEREGVNPYGYYPASQQNPVILPVGDDLQDKYHEQKRLDAHRRVMNAVADNRASTARFLKSHQNYIVPKPVLSQRIYANPSNGNQADIYSHRPIQWEVNWDNMVGGVLFTQEAQKWGRQKLRDRIGQLDAIQQAKQEFLTGVPMVDATAGVPAGVEEFPIGSKVELVATLQTIATTIEGSKTTAFTLGETVKFLRLLFRWATTASLDDLQDVMEYIDDIITKLIGIQDEFEEGVAEGADDLQFYNEKLLEMMRKVREYLKAMIGAVNKPNKERQKVSIAYIKSSGFTNLLRPTTEQKGREQKERQAKNSGYDEKFDEVPREEMANRSGSFFGEASSSASSASSSNSSFRDSMKSAELPIAEAKQEEAEFEAEGKEEAKAKPIVKPIGSLSPQQQNSLERSKSKDPKIWIPSYLYRSNLMGKSQDELYNIALRVSREGKSKFGTAFKGYIPKSPNSSYQSMYNGFKKFYGI